MKSRFGATELFLINYKKNLPELLQSAQIAPESQDMKKPALLSLIAFAVLSASGLTASAQEPWDPVPPTGGGVKEGPAQTVPDGGSTVALLGTALMGLTVFRRKFLK